MVALFPHPETERILELLRGKLFAGGALRSYDVPPCLPLSFPDRPLNRRELRVLADALRDGASRFALAAPALIPGPFGTPVIACPLSGTTLGGNPALLVAVLESEEEGRAALAGTAGNPAADFPLVFTAAFVANATIRSDAADEAGSATFAEWIRGEAVWVPSPRRIAAGGRRSDADHGTR